GPPRQAVEAALGRPEAEVADRPAGRDARERAPARRADQPLALRRARRARAGAPRLPGPDRGRLARPLVRRALRRRGDGAGRREVARKVPLPLGEGGTCSLDWPSYRSPTDSTALPPAGRGAAGDRDDLAGGRAGVLRSHPRRPLRDRPRHLPRWR